MNHSEPPCDLHDLRITNAERTLDKLVTSVDGIKELLNKGIGAVGLAMVFQPILTGLVIWYLTKGGHK